MALMDRLLSIPLQLEPHFSREEPIPSPLGDQEFWALKRRTTVPTDSSNISITIEILKLSDLLSSVCHAYRESNSKVILQGLVAQFDGYAVSLHPTFHYTPENLSRQLEGGTLRKFAFMHLLYHHIGQLLFFHSLKSTYVSGPSVSSGALKCHQHAFSILEIIEYARNSGGFDLHNFSMGQVLSIATVVHGHALLTARSIEVAEQLQRQVATMRDCVLRIQRHTRLFNWVLQHLEGLWRILSQNTPGSAHLFDQNPNLLREMLQLGSFYESVDQRTGGTPMSLRA
ncbi:hypothetical protein BX600DRAFT_454995 [Xylariales sp. PMI_506]|nr:hypothetical protein BX600DRAFT_454995 [Xylariales sp. PMI_506]